MAKGDDFGGLPETIFVSLVADVRLGAAGSLGLANAADQVAILAALAVAEHAAATSIRIPNSYDYMEALDKPSVGAAQMTVRRALVQLAREMSRERP